MANALKDRNVNEHSSIENDSSIKIVPTNFETTKETSQSSPTVDEVEEHSTISDSVVNEPSPTIEEVTELLSTNSVSTTSGSFRQRNYKSSPLQMKKREESQEERRARALADQRKVILYSFIKINNI